MATILTDDERERLELGTLSDIEIARIRKRILQISPRELAAAIMDRAAVEMAEEESPPLIPANANR